MVRKAKRIVAVGGGKGGVGKSLVACNLAVAFAEAGARTVLIDADLGAANQHTLFGMDKSGPTIYSLINKEIDDIEDIMVPIGVDNLSLVPGCGAIPGAANIGHAQKQRLMRRIEAIDTDVVVIDVGAGITFNVVDLFTMADLRLIVLLPQLTSFQNAYAFMKAAVFRVVRDAARIVDRQYLVDELAPSTETDRITTLVNRLREENVHVGEMAQRRVDAFGAYLLGNQIIAPKDRSTISAVARMFKDFLGVDPEVLGHLRYNRLLAESINERRPLMLSHPSDDCAKAIGAAAQTLLAVDVDALQMRRTMADERSAVAQMQFEDDGLMDEIQALLSA